MAAFGAQQAQDRHIQAAEQIGYLKPSLCTPRVARTSAAWACNRTAFAADAADADVLHAGNAVGTLVWDLRQQLLRRDYTVVDSGVIGLAHPRSGHFDLGTGYHGDVWLDLDALFLRPALLRPHISLLADRLQQHQVDAVCGPMEGGAFLAQAIADRLGTAFLAAHRAVATRPGEATEYRVPCVQGGIGGWRVAIVDDAVNAGTAVRACFGQLRGRGAIPVAVAALLSLGTASATVAEAMSVPFYTAGTIDGQTWPADKCPLCASNTPLTDPSCHD